MSAPKRKTPQHKPATTRTLNVRIPDAQFEKLVAAARKCGLTVADTARLSIERGLLVLVGQLTTPPSTVQPS